MKLRRLKIRNFRGIQDLSVEIPPRGVIVEGENAAGKTSVVRSIQAALGAQGIGPDAVRIGEEESQILVDVDELRVKRRIAISGKTDVNVYDADDVAMKKPQTFLNEILGVSTLDPLSFYLADPKERRRMLLESMPVTVTAEDLARWTDGLVDRIEGSAPVHGMELIESMREKFYQLRTPANREAKEAAESAARARKLARDLEPALTKAPDEGEAKRTVERLVAVLADIDAQAAAGAEAAKMMEGARAQVTLFREEAQRHAERARGAPGETDVEESRAALPPLESEVSRLRAELAAAEKALADGQLRVKRRSQAVEAAAAASASAAAATARADQLEASLVPSVPPEDRAALRSGTELALHEARQRVAHAQDAARALAAHRAYELMDQAANVARAEAERLDRIVATLTDVAPKEIAGRSQMIPGLAFVGASMTLDGVAIDMLNTARQMELSIEIAKRANAKARFLVVDGLERINDKRLVDFVRMATADGWQLIGTRVQDGELVIHAIANDEAAS